MLVDEGVDYPVVKRLRKHEYDVDSVLEQEPGISDDKVLDRAVSEERIVVTSDKDFGEMIFRQHYEVPGVILLRLSGLSPTEKAEIVTDVVDDADHKLIDRFTVVDPEKIRMRPMNE